MQDKHTAVQNIINQFDTPQTRQMLKDIGLDAFKKKFLLIATKLDLSDVDDPELQPIFIK